MNEAQHIAARGPLAGYVVPGLTGDLFTAAPPEVQAKWHLLAQGLAGQCGGDFDALHGQIAHLIQDLGMAFRLSGDADERAWPLGPMPLLIGSGEWSAIERGLVQRADLLERIVADIYGA
jgi:uncharacterized circularly permuted ATP-grasp superfamily protein